MPLTEQERYRYSRQIDLIGEEGQERLQHARVLIAGMGGLGTLLAGYLAGSGIGFLRIVDHDTVDESNLPRQLLYGPEDIAKAKTASAVDRLVRMNPFCRIEALPRTIDAITAPELIAGIHIIVDALDNYAARQVLNRAAVKRGIPMIHGAVRDFYGQVLSIVPHRGACLQCVFTDDSPRRSFSILGPTCGVIASIQATEVIKYITGIGTLLIGRMFIWNGLVAEAEIIDVARNPTCRVCGGPDGGTACGSS